MSIETEIIIDKTEPVEEILKRKSVICLCGMPGIGKKTMVKTLLKHHPETEGKICSVEELEPSVPGEGKRCTWYLVRKLENREYPGLTEKLWDFLRQMSGEDKMIFATDGMLPEALLEFLWNGILEMVYPENFWFTEAETYRYLKGVGSVLDRGQTYRLTRGWPGCIALMARIQKQLPEKWTPEELCSRYEIRRYVEDKILGSLSEKEERILTERASLPRLEKDLEELLWQKHEKETEERFLVSGIMSYVSRGNFWRVHPVIRQVLGQGAGKQDLKNAVNWYETRGYISEALECCQNLCSERDYQEFLIRNYDRISFLPCRLNFAQERSEEEKPELFFLKWMEIYFSQRRGKMEKYYRKGRQLWLEAEKTGKDLERWREVFLNISYVNPLVEMREWMELAKKLTGRGRRLRLYYILGESFSYLSGIRDLTPLFACPREETRKWEQIWRERLTPQTYLAYRLAKLEYDFQTDRIQFLELEEVLREIGPESLWQLRLGKLFLLYVLAEGEEGKNQVQMFLEDAVEDLKKEESEVCRYNTMALYYLSKAKWGEKEDMLRWFRDTGGDIENKWGKTCFHMAAQVKIHLYLENYVQAEKALKILIPFFRENRIWKYWAESLFQMAMVEKARGREAEALRWTAEAVQKAESWRYVRIFTGYGPIGRELLEDYLRFLEKGQQEPVGIKKKYKYGNVKNMPYKDWLDYILRKAKKSRSSYPGIKKEEREVYAVEKLTLTEQMVLQYLKQGCTNGEISREMNIKLSTVKSHIYNIYKKLGVSTRLQAVEKGREKGFL